MSDDITNGDARAIADVGETPRVTDTLPPAGAPAPPATGLKDKRGNAFSPELHSVDRLGNPMMRADGGWMLKRGNGARKTKGLPPSGYVSYKAKPGPTAAASSTPPPASNSAPPAGDVDQVDDQVVHTAELEESPTLLEADYEATASAVQQGLFSISRLLLGPAWQEDPDERAAWRGCLRRVWHHYQLPRVGPLLELSMLIPVTIAKRREDARTREGWKKILAWLGMGPAIAPPKPPEQQTEEKQAA